MAEITPSTGYRFATITPDDHSGGIYIAVFLSFIYANITFITRCALKWHMFGFDDWAMLVAQVIFVIQFILILVSLNYGLGKTFNLLSNNDYNRMASSQFANLIVLYLCLGLSKCASMLLVQRLFTRDARKFWMICNVVTGLMLVWTVFAVLTVSAGCSPKTIAPFAAKDACTSLETRYKAVVALDCVTDVILVIVPAYLVWQLQMKTLLKVQVLSAFAFRLPLLPLAILALKYYTKSLTSANPGVDRSNAIAFQQSQICYSLMAATIPCLKAFIRSFDTGSGAKAGITTAYGSSGGYGNSNSYRMQDLSGNASALRSRNEDGDLKVNTKPFGHGRGRALSSTKVSSGNYPAKEDSSITSHGSQEMIIRRDVKWEVKTENPSR